jgi:uncharacterized protein YndB with AHSA1/START domain
VITGDTSRTEAVFPDRIESVWQALTNSDELAAWLMENDFVARVGHRFTMRCDPDGDIECQVLELDPPRRMVWSWNGEFGETTVVFELSRVRNGTHLAVEHRSWTEDNMEDAKRFDSGWPGKLGALTALLRSLATDHGARRAGQTGRT